MPCRASALLLAMLCALAAPAGAATIVMQNGQRFQGALCFSDDRQICLMAGDGQVVRLERRQVAKVEADPRSPSERQFAERWARPAVPPTTQELAAAIGLMASTTTPHRWELRHRKVWTQTPWLDLELASQVGLGYGTGVLDQASERLQLTHWSLPLALTVGRGLYGGLGLVATSLTARNASDGRQASAMSFTVGPVLGARYASGQLTGFLEVLVGLNGPSTFTGGLAAPF